MAAILILDDDFELASQWRQALMAEGYGVDLSHSSSEAIAIEDTDQFDLFVVDLLIKVDVPDMTDSGAVFLRHLARKYSDRIGRPPVIGVSGFKPLGMGQPVLGFFKAYRVDSYLLKPFPAADLVREIKALLEPA
ncbi:MAG: response regulator [Pseudomonadota bacterium]